MARSAEVVRQWKLLKAIEAARLGETVRSLAAQAGVSTRTIWRDIAALQEAGFPVYDEKDESGRTRFKLAREPFRHLAERGFTVAQLGALYFARTLVDCFVGTPFGDDLREAFDGIATALPPRMRQFLDRLPGLLVAKPTAVKRRDLAREKETIARLLDATLHNRRVNLHYHSRSSNRTKDYLIEPYRLVYASGGLYLMAFVPEYGQVRTFALERIRRFVLTDERFVPREPLAPDPFPHSLGAFSGPPERIELEFSPAIAPYVRERLWHPSQKLVERRDGSVRLVLHVCRDATLMSFVLSFGPHVRVVAPSSLAEQILEALEAAREHYMPRMVFDEPPPPGYAGQPLLPLLPSERSRPA